MDSKLIKLTFENDPFPRYSKYAIVVKAILKKGKKMI